MYAPRIAVVRDRRVLNACCCWSTPPLTATQPISAPSTWPTSRAGPIGLLQDCGLHITDTGNGVATNPAGFNELFPASGGALYGRASHGMMAEF